MFGLLEDKPHISKNQEGSFEEILLRANRDFHRLEMGCFDLASTNAGRANPNNPECISGQS